MIEDVHVIKGRIELICRGCEEPFFSDNLSQTLRGHFLLVPDNGMRV
jgi:hypothetical protein